MTPFVSCPEADREEAPEEDSSNLGSSAHFDLEEALADLLEEEERQEQLEGEESLEAVPVPAVLEHLDVELPEPQLLAGRDVDPQPRPMRPAAGEVLGDEEGAVLEWPPEPVRCRGFVIAGTRNRQGVCALEAVCPHHRLSERTGCKKRVNLPDLRASSVTHATTLLLWWCSRAREFDRQRLHLRVQLVFGMAVPDAVLVRNELDAHPDPPAEGAVADNVLDEIAPRAKAKAKGKAKPGAKPGAKAKAKPRPLPNEAAAPAEPVPQQDGSSDSSSSSSSSSSSGTSACSGGGAAAQAEPVSDAQAGPGRASSSSSSSSRTSSSSSSSS